MPSAPGQTTARIADALRLQIARGHWKPGEKIPTVAQLIKRHRVSRTSVIHAIRLLEQEGLISPQVGRGTFVRDRHLRGEIAVVLSRDLLAQQSSPYYRMVASQIMAGIKDISSQCRGRLHLASLPGRYGQPPADLDLLDDQVLLQLAGVFTFHRLFDVGQQLAQRHIPLVSMASGNDQLPAVRFDRLHGYRLALQHLRQAGAQRVAVLSVNLPDFPFYERWSAIERIAADVGLGVINMLGTSGTPHGGDVEQIGQTLFHALLDGPDAPDAVFVSDDMLCRGVLWAALERGIRFPQDLMLVSFANRNLPLPTTQPVTTVEFDPVELAAAAIRCMRQQAAAEPATRQADPPTHTVPPVLRLGQTTGHHPASASS